MSGLSFDTKADAEAATIAGGVTYVLLAGYGAPGDGGGAQYIRVGAEPPHDGKFQSADGAWWELAAQSFLTPEMFGAIGDGSANNSSAFTKLFAYVNPNHTQSASAGQVVIANCLAKQYKANIVIPSVTGGGNPAPTFGIFGAGENNTQIIAATMSLPAISFDGSTATNNYKIYLRDFQVNQGSTANRSPGISLIGNQIRMGGAIQNVSVRQARYSNGGGAGLYLEDALGFVINNFSMDNGHYVFDFFGSSNVSVYGGFGRTGSGALIRLNTGANNTFIGCRVEDANNGFHTLALDMAMYHLTDVTSTTFINCANEGGDGIQSVIYMIGTGNAPSLPQCVNNQWINCNYSSGQRTDIATFSIREVGNCHSNLISGRFSNWVSLYNTTAGTYDISYEPNSHGQYPRSEEINLKNSVSGNAVIPTTNGVRTGLANVMRSEDVRQRVMLIYDGGQNSTANATLLAYQMAESSVQTNDGATGAVTLTLPIARIGLGATFLKMEAQTFRLDPNGTEIIRGGGAGKYLSLTNLGDSVKLYCREDGVWDIVSAIGAYTFEI